MKLWIVLVTLVATTATAKPVQHLFAARWIRGLQKGHKTTQFFGQTPEGQRCALHFTDHGESHYVVVGLNGSNDPNDFIGVATNEETEIELRTRLLHARAGETWGNDSSTNVVTIQLNGGGNLIRATGTSDLKTIVCSLTGEVMHE